MQGVQPNPNAAPATGAANGPNRLSATSANCPAAPPEPHRNPRPTLGRAPVTRQARGARQAAAAGSSRPVARQGAAAVGQTISIDTVHPEPTVTVEGMWWHPVAVTDPGMKVADIPLPLGAALATIRDTLATQNAATGRGRRHVFRCT